MQKTQDKKHPVPVIDCPSCGKKNSPLTTVGPFIKKGKPDIYVSGCSNCDRVPLGESEIKGYISIEELEAMGWSKEKP